MATGGSFSKDERRIVLLGKIGAGKSALANRLLGHEVFKAEERGLCVLKQGEHAGKRLIVVDTPGWDRVSVQRTPEQIKDRIAQSPMRCLPGPHALLVVLPVSMQEDRLSINEIKSAIHHVELLSARAWRHAIVLFVCQDKVDKSLIDQKVQEAKKLIDKCDGGYFVLHRDTEVSSLLQRIDDVVDENCGDFLIPQVYYEVFEKRMPSGMMDQSEMYEKREQDLKQKHKDKLKEMEGKFSPRRRQSMDRPPKMSDAGLVQHQDSVTQVYDEEFVTVPRYYLRVLGVILAAVIGAFVGSIGGADKGVLGSCTGMVTGFVIGLLVGLLVIGATRLVKGNTILTLVFGGAEPPPEVKPESPGPGAHLTTRTFKKEKKQ